MTIAFIACVERGYLEEQAMLLCRSIRRYAGRFRASRIYTFQPRRGREVSPRTLALFDELGVIHSTERLNVDFEDYAYGNKIFACARAEEKLTEDVLVFLDSDTIITGEPADLDLPDGIDGAALPVCRRKLGSAGPTDPNEEYWSKLYRICGVKNDAFVKTVIDGELIRPYFNSGLVAVRRDAGLFTQWRDDFLRLMRAGHVSEATGITGMDEFSLAATFGRAFDRVRILDLRYNYPLTPYERAALGSPWREAQLEDLIHVHYRYWFNRTDYLKLIRPSLNQDSDIIEWLGGYLPFEPAMYKPLMWMEASGERASQ